MFKVILSAVLLMATAAASADSIATSATDSTNILPVIIKNEPIDAKMCRLYFENGTQKDVACENTAEKT